MDQVREVAVMTKVRPVCTSLVLVLALTAPHSIAQPILVGCTAGITGQQFNTSRIVTVNQTTGLAENAKDSHVLDIVGLATQPATGLLFGLTMFTSTPANALTDD